MHTPMPMARRRTRLVLEELEDRRVPGVLSYIAPNGTDHNLAGRLSSSGNKLEVYDNGSLVEQAVLGETDSVQITGADRVDRLTLDYSFGGVGKPVRCNGGPGVVDDIADCAQ